MEKVYEVKGMTCVICKGAVENALNKCKGVNKVSVNLMDNEVSIDFDENSVKIEDLAASVKDAGYELVINKAKKNDVEKIRFIISIVLIIILMINSMGFMEYKISQLILASIVSLLNFRFFKSGIKALIKNEPNMDSLVALSSGISYIYSIYVLLTNNGHLYFESGAMILVFVSIGKRIEGINKKKTTKVIRGLSTLIPMQANRIENDEIKVVPIEEIKKGDILVIKPGESVPSDGVVLEGLSSIDESLITGESLPQMKQKDSSVIAGTINIEGTLKILVNKNTNQSMLSKIVSLTKQASMSKIKIERLADMISKYFVYGVLGISLLTFTIWMVVTKDVGMSLRFAISVLVISCPCALGLATPSAITVACGQSAKNGLLIKNPEVLEVAGSLKTIILDKTGTLTENKLNVVDIKVYDDDFIDILTSLEKKSNHPIAKSIIEKYGEGKLDLSIKEIPGEGIESDLYFAGNKKIFERLNINLDEEDLKYARDNNYSYIGVASKDKVLGLIYLEDQIKKTSRAAIDGFKDRGIKAIMATGDNEIAAKICADKLGIEEYIAGAKPNDKQELLKENKEFGKVAMVGDGINDTISLSSADVSFTLNSGCDIAHASSDVVLIHNDINDINFFVDLAKGTMRIIKQNLFWAFFYNSAFIPIAAGVLYPTFGIMITPMFGAVAMWISSAIVLTNALRIKKINKETNHE